ncbi:hypothetical protein I3843_01G175000 [Carya illinoinensis]|uniref:C2H2-type domain-containing protein n=1 Tax=Carya illinoinensis TaxID=32201 RepID=A0A922G4X8_CARIL|nr:hypothetical protein I3760_01G179800 [Carya illinoinensis]KAG6732520.1 hypothetical protein I3842_01G182500 [Carya illinoinensis]KAG7996706.1 hypothetical protein I3843_01G175000 [Carya illinoinensis]
MAEYGWNIRRHRYSTANGLNRGRQVLRPLNRTQIACRFCDLVFMNTQAFIRHVESHMLEEESSSRRRQHRRNRMPSQRPIFNSFVTANYFCLPTPPRGTTVPLFLDRLRTPVQLPSAVLPERHHFLGVNRIVAPRPRPAPPLQISPPMARRHDSSQLTSSQLTPAAAPQAQTRALEPIQETRPTDSTQPYLNQLEHPITAIVEVVDSNNDNSTISGLNKLDLALKL